LEYDPSNDQWKVSHKISTLMGGSTEEMKKEYIVSELMSNIQYLNVQNEQELIIQTNIGEYVRLERFEVSAPEPVTRNIFS